MGKKWLAAASVALTVAAGAAKATTVVVNEAVDLSSVKHIQYLAEGMLFDGLDWSLGALPDVGATLNSGDTLQINFNLSGTVHADNLAVVLFQAPTDPGLTVGPILNASLQIAGLGSIPGLASTGGSGTGGEFFNIGGGDFDQLQITVPLGSRVGGATKITDLGLQLSGVGLSSPNLAGVTPEPSAWLTMMLGFGAVGATLRSRRRPAVGV